MGFLDSFLGVLIGLIAGTILNYFLNRYFYKKVMDRGLDHLEFKIKSWVRKEKQ